MRRGRRSEQHLLRFPHPGFEEASALHTAQARLATTAFLERNPESFDHEELLQRMFGKSALQGAYQQQAKAVEETRAKQIHQKPEIGEVTILETRSDFVLCRVRGQLIRAGIFNDRPFTEAVPFTLSFKMLRNPDMLSNARFPTVVNSFRYDENETSFPPAWTSIRCRRSQCPVTL